VEAIDRVRISELTGTDAYIGGFVDHRAGSCSRSATARSRAAAAAGGGTQFTSARMAGTPQRSGGQWIVSTATAPARGQGDHRDERLHDLAGAQGVARLARTVIPVYSYIARPRPLSDDLRRAILPKGQAGVRLPAAPSLTFRLDAADGW